LAGSGKRHVAALNGLRPNATYSYRILAEDIPLMDAATFRTNRDESHPEFSFVVFGDSGTGDHNQARVAAQIHRVEADFGLITGDVVYPRGASEDYESKYFLPYRDIISSICFYPTMGNHDYYTDNGKPYLDTFVLPANNPAKSEKYYSFDYGNAHIVSIDSVLPTNGPEEKEQFEWVRQDLASSRKLWKFAFLHHPPYSTSLHGSEMRIRRRYSPLFEEYDVDIVFCGHDHNYQRTVKIKEFFPEKEGVVYIVTGGGGGHLYDIGRSARIAFAKKIFHFVHVKINKESLELSAIDDRGNEFDSLSLDKSSSKAVWIRWGAVVFLIVFAGAIILKTGLMRSRKATNSSTDTCDIG